MLDFCYSETAAACVGFYKAGQAYRVYNILVCGACGLPFAKKHALCDIDTLCAEKLVKGKFVESHGLDQYVARRVW